MDTIHIENNVMKLDLGLPHTSDRCSRCEMLYGSDYYQFTSSVKAKEDATKEFSQVRGNGVVPYIQEYYPGSMNPLMELGTDAVISLTVENAEDVYLSLNAIRVDLIRRGNIWELNTTGIPCMMYTAKNLWGKFNANTKITVLHVKMDERIVDGTNFYINDVKWIARAGNCGIAFEQTTLPMVEVKV